MEGDLNAEELATLASQLGSALEVRSRHQFTTHAQAIDAALADIEPAAECHYHRVCRPG
ncbi:hypothetical protein ACFSC4_31605 [Deinococcus malanensis]|uniref:hypothetical protein n=1 Tax=Deinococcus malanensis TaxID=1706855 RepID=UPI0036321B40